MNQMTLGSDGVGCGSLGRDTILPDLDFISVEIA
jgi:hypothetical protein